MCVTVTDGAAPVEASFQHDATHRFNRIDLRLKRLLQFCSIVRVKSVKELADLAALNAQMHFGFKFVFNAHPLHHPHSSPVA